MVDAARKSNLPNIPSTSFDDAAFFKQLQEEFGYSGINVPMIAPCIKSKTEHINQRRRVKI